MRIYFVRHGKTEWNLERRLQGQKGDSPLLSESVASVKRVRKVLEDVSFDEVLSSPQKRAMTTAHLLTDLPVKPDKRLAEWNFGELEGNLITEAIAKEPEQMHYSRFELEKFDGSSFGAESVESVLKRWESLARELLHSPFHNVLLIGHGASGTAGVRHLVGIPVEKIREEGGLENNTVTVLEADEEREHFRMLTWNKSYDE
ncbi:histidine phosphatase family protein [Lactococcus nasutitermitis]|uniref:Histidine phosphatase family protein n=1 Tax=Lactococcus nasutitermitis TaxID=1652957 RepID=A0ABV9JDH5_9LACT|nr:histidine phosphatase family protein [Lactococcus nasutitermitis]